MRFTRARKQEAQLLLNKTVRRLQTSRGYRETQKHL